jgi:hypothetical protein
MPGSDDCAAELRGTVETILPGLVFVAFLFAHVSAVVAVHAQGTRHGPHALHVRRTQRIWWAFPALASFFLSSSACPQDLNDVAQRFLQRHGVPCSFVLRVGSPHDLGEVATCEDGRAWALFWLEDEIAFVHPQTLEAYKWDRQIYLSHPEIYFGSDLGNERRLLVSDGRP